MSSIRDIISENDSIEKFLQILSLDQQIKVANKDVDKNIARIASDFFTSITKGGVPVYDIIRELYSKYGDSLNERKQLDNIGDEDIKIIHNSGYNITTKNGNSINTKDINFYLKKTNNVSTERFGLYNIENTQANLENIVLSDISSCISKTINKSSNNSFGVNINKKPSNPTKLNNPGIVSILYNEPKYRFGTRNDTELSFFLNNFTNLDISKSLPYVNVSVKMPSLIDNGFRKKTFETSTINQFLFGTVEEDLTTNTFKIFGNNNQKVTNKDRGVEESTNISNGMNMSLFTMPQTYNNFNEKNIGQNKSDILDGRRINPVLDITRPLATIKSIDFQTTPTYSLKGHKQATIDLVVHDRSRLPDVAPFIKTDMYGTSGPEFIIDYGWSHIDGNVLDNPKARIINNMKVKEKYNIIQTSSTVNPDGQVNIKLTLSLVGNSAFDSIIVKESSLAGIINSINTSKQKIRNLLKTVNNINKKGSKIIYSFDTEFANNITITPVSRNAESLEPEVLEALQTGLNLIKSNFKFNKNNIVKFMSLSPEKIVDSTEGQDNLTADIRNHQDFFENIKNHLIEIKKNSNLLAKKIQEGKTSIRKEFKEIFGSGNDLDDPYIDKVHIAKLFGNISDNDPFPPNDQIINAVVKNNVSKVLNNYCSFGKIATYFISNYMTTLGKFDEIQMVYHTVNGQAGLMRYNNISSFLINKKELEEFFVNDLFSPERNVKYSVEAMFTRLIKEFIDDESQVGYGLKDIFDKKDKMNSDDYKKARKEKLENIYGRGNDITFKRGNIKIFLDCISPSEVSNQIRKEDDKTVLRISFADLNDDPFNSINSIIKNTTNDNDIIKLNKKIVEIRKNNKVKEGNNKNKKQTFKLLENDVNEIKEILKDKIDISKNNEILISMKELKNIKQKLKARIPSVTVGAENSPVNTATATLSTSGDLNVIFLNRQAKKYKVKGVKFDADLPLRVVPSQITMKMLGCPFLNFGQYIFLDFLTGTNIDNSYVVTSINHNISPGRFTTSVTFGQGSAQAYSEYYSGIETISKFISEIENKKDLLIPEVPTAEELEEAKEERIESSKIEEAKKIIYEIYKSGTISTLYPSNSETMPMESSIENNILAKKEVQDFKNLIFEKSRLKSDSNLTYKSYIKYLYDL